MPEHVDITEAQLHEPKGISLALTGQVLTADGAGSGGWADPMPIAANNTVIVESAADLPTPIANVYILESDKLYIPCCPIDLGAGRIQLGDKSIIVGLHRNLSSFISTTSDPLISGTGVDCRITNMEFDAPNSSSLINYDGGGTSTLRVIDCKSLNIGAGNDAIVSANSAATLVQLCLFIGGRDHLRLTGTSNSALLIDTCGFFSFTGDGLGYGISTWDDCSIKSSTFSGAGGSFSINGATSSANINSGKRATVSNCNFNGSGTALNGITVTDNRFQFTNNANVPDSTSDAQIFLDTNATASENVNTAGGVVIAASTWQEEIAERFTTTSAGRMTYTGEQPLNRINIVASVTGAGASGSNEYSLYIAKNGTVIEASKVNNTFPSTAESSVSLFTLTGAVTNDFFELYVFRSTDVDFTAIDANMIISV